MWETIAFVLGVAAVFSAWRLHRLRETLREMADAAQARVPVLADLSDRLLRRYHLERLSKSLGELLSEHAKASAEQMGYLAQIEATLGNIKEAVLLVDDEQRVVLANAAAAELLGVENVAAGKRLDAVMRGSGLLDYIYRTLRGESLPRAEFVLTPGKEQQRWIELSGAPVRTPTPTDGKLFLFVIHDISQLKALESVRKEFVANVSHELRTPLTVIKGFADTLYDDDAKLSPGDRLRFLEKIRRHADRLAAIVNDLLELSRLENGQPGGEGARPCSLRGVIEEAAGDFADRYAATGAVIEMDFHHSPDSTAMDPFKISQVMNNLFDNALRHARGMKRLRIETRTEGSVVRVVVEDDGCGIPAGDAPHVFERFYRVDKGRSRESGGTGLGLAIVKHIIQMHGGNVACEGGEGKGARFVFTLPVATEEK